MTSLRSFPARAGRAVSGGAHHVVDVLIHPRAIDGPGRFVVVSVIFAATFYGVPAFADTAASINDTVKLFNAHDSHGLSISQYQLSIDMGGVTNLNAMPLGQMLQFTWACYVWWIGFIGWLADWTLQMDWVPYVVGPISEVSQRLHDSILAPLGLTSLAGQGVMGMLMAIAAALGAWKASRVGAASGILSIIVSSAAAALAVGIFAMPVASIAGSPDNLGKPLVYARGFGIQIVATIQGKTELLPGGTFNDVLTPGRPLPKPAAKQDKTIHVLEQVPDELKISTMLVDTLVRPAHQQINYGADIDNGKCSSGSSGADAYDEALKKGPYWDWSPKQQRADIGKCNDAWKKYADNPSPLWLGTVLLYLLAGFLLGLVIGCFVFVLCRSVAAVVWGAFKTTYQALAAISMPSAWGSVSQSLMEIGGGLWMIVTNLVMFVVAMMMARGVLTNEDIPRSLRFAAVDFVLVFGLGLLTINYLQTWRGQKNLAQKMRERFGTPERKLNWGQLGRDMTLGYTAYNELQEKRAVMRGESEPRAVEGTKRPRLDDRALVKVGAATRKGKQIVSTASAASGGAVTLAAHAAKETAIKAANGYQEIVNGHEVRGWRKAALPLAKTHASVRSHRNKVLNAGSQTIETLDEQRLAAKNGATRAEVASSGSTTLDKAARQLGASHKRVTDTKDNLSSVVNASRHPVRRSTDKPTTGRRPVDAGLKGVGKTLHLVDQGAEAYNKPAAVHPGTPRTTRADLQGMQRTTTPQRSADGGVQGTRRRAKPRDPALTGQK